MVVELEVAVNVVHSDGGSSTSNSRFVHCCGLFVESMPSGEMVQVRSWTRPWKPWLFMYVCIYIYVYIYICTYICLYIYMYIFARGRVPYIGSTQIDPTSY